MPVDKDINLDDPEGISTEDIEIMKREAAELEKLATNAESNAEKIDKAKKSIEGLTFAQLNVLDKSFEGSVGEAGLSEQKLLDFKTEILKEIGETKKEVKKNSKKISEEEKARKAELKKVREQKGEISEINGAINGFRSNPFGFAKGKALGMLGKLGVWGIVAQFAIDMAQQAFDQTLAEVKKQFGAGGAWDKRKLVLDVLKEYNSIDYLTKVKSGQVLFTADAGQDLRQGAPRGSFNTRDLRDGHLRFIQLHAGV